MPPVLPEAPPTAAPKLVELLQATTAATVDAVRQAAPSTFHSTAHVVVAMLAVVPLVYLSYRVFRTLFAFLKAVFIYVVAPIFYKPDLNKYAHRWTVVSGGTDGIGKAYTYELAQRGLRKFVLIGRNASKLSDVKAYLELQHSCIVKTFVFDFLTDDYANLRDYIADIDVGFVVNSVGVGRENLERFGDNPEADSQILRVNGLGSAEFLSLVLPPMEKSGGGQIVVLSSSQGIRPIPMLAAYSSTKSMMSFLCETIDREYSTISVQCLIPALIATKMTYYTEGSMFVVTPENFCRQAVGSLGLTKKTSGCFSHEVQLLGYEFFPWTLLKYIIMPIYHHQRSRVAKLHATHKAMTIPSGDDDVKKSASRTSANA